MPDIISDQIQFLEYSAPDLPGGTYTFSAKMNLNWSRNKDKGNDKEYGSTPELWGTTINIQASAPRFRLAAGDVYSTSPSDGSIGNFANVVPSIHFHNPSLPWVRRPGQSNDRTSWLALICVAQSELADIVVSTSTVQQYCTDHHLSLEDGDVAEEALLLLNIPNNYHNLFPTTEDLPFTAAVKHSALTGDLASLMGNRLPAVGKNVVYLVSVENRYPLVDPGTWVFPVLYSWSFEVFDPALEVNHLLADMAQHNLSFCLPPVPEQNAPQPEANPNNWLKYGYVLLPHQFRNGQTSVSWYRGPLSTTRFLTPPVLPAITADTLSLFVPTTGMLDVSYATAWQLGRQMALQSNNFASTLYKWKRQMMLLEKSRQQVASRNSSLPVLAKINRWNVLNNAQFIFFKFGVANQHNTWVDMSGSQYTATLLGAPKVRLNDIFGSSVYLNPTNSSDAQYILINTDRTLYTAGTNFYSFWFQPDSNLEDSKEYGLWSIWGTELVEGLEKPRNSQLFSMTMSKHQVTVSYSNSIQQTTIDLSGFVWHHVLVEVSIRDIPNDDNHKLADLQVYFSNQPVISLSFSIPNIAGTTTIRLGSCVGGADRDIDNFRGGIANFRAYQTNVNKGDMDLIREGDLIAQKLHPWFNNWAVLKDIPFNYLVPDERMLPPDSIRFFKVDAHWMNCFADGAFSIGRFSNATLAEDAQLLEKIQLMPYPNISGLIIRSSVVSEIKQLNVDGFNNVITETGEIEHKLPCLRKELLSDDTLLILFDGDVETVQIYPAPEMVHYGFNMVLDANDPMGYRYEKELRDSEGNDSVTIRIDSSELDRSTRVIHIQPLVQSFMSHLSSAGFSRITSAEYALEMLEKTWKVQINAAP